MGKNAWMVNVCRRQQQNLRKSPCKVPDAALKQKTFFYPRPS
jgi:hypothetical protein